MNAVPLSGVFAATITPYSAGGEIDTKVVAQLVRSLIARGVTGVCPAGTTGEFPFLGREEKDVLLSVSCRAAGHNPVVAGVWGRTEDERHWLARRAAGHGASAVFLTTPFFYPSPPDQILEWYRSVRRAAGAAVLAYNIPQFTANEIPLETLDTLAAEGTIAGYKDSSPDAGRVRAAARLLKGRIPVFAGHESVFPEARDFGVDGFISGLANAFPRLVTAVWRGEDDAARRLLRVSSAVAASGGIAALKHLVSMRGIPVGEAREPIAKVSPAAAAELAEIDRECGETP